MAHASSYSRSKLANRTTMNLRGMGTVAHVGAHNRSPLERDEVSIGSVSITSSLDRHVTQSHQILGNFDLEVESSFVIRLVKARECLSGIAGLELGAHHIVMLAIRRGACHRGASRLVLRSIEAGHVVVHNAGKVDGHDSLRWLELLGEFDGSPLRRLIVRNAGGLERLRTCFKGASSEYLGENLSAVLVLYRDLTIFQSDFSSVDLNGLHIEHDLRGRLDNLGIDLDLSIVGPGTAELQVEQREVIMGRFHPENTQSEDRTPKQSKPYPSWTAGWCKQWDSRHGTYDLGKVSLSFASILLNSEEQYLRGTVMKLVLAGRRERERELKGKEEEQSDLDLTRRGRRGRQAAWWDP